LTEFPEFLHNQDELKHLSLSDNNIQGSIPQWFVQTTKDNLLDLDLSDNLLKGFEQPILDLPWSFLEVFDFNRNRMQGELPNPSESMV